MQITQLVLDGALYALVASTYLLLALALNPRLFLQDYPEVIQAQVPPKTARERRWSLIVGLPFLALLIAGPVLSTLALRQRLGGQSSFVTLATNAFGVAFAFNLVDWLILDGLIFCAWTPRFLVVPGTEGHPAYKDYGYHTHSFLKGTGFSLIAGLLIGATITLL